MIDLTAGLQMPQASNTRIPKAKSAGKAETDKFDALTNEEMIIRMQDEKLNSMRQALDSKVKELYDSGDVKGAEKMSISGMSELKLMQMRNNATKNEAMSRKKDYEETSKKIGTEDLNRLYLHKTENGNFVQVFNPESGKAMTNAEVKSKGWEGLNIVPVMDKEGKPVIGKDSGKQLMAFERSARLDQNGNVSLSALNIGFNKYSDWKKPYIELFKGKNQYETGGYAGMSTIGGQNFMVKSEHADDRANIDNAFKAMFTEVEKVKGKKVIRFSVDKMLSQMSDQDRQSFYQDYYGSKEYKTKQGEAMFAKNRMTEISDAARDVTKDTQSYTEITEKNPNGGDGEGRTEWEQFVLNKRPIDNIGSEKLVQDSKTKQLLMPFYDQHGVKVEGKFMPLYGNSGGASKASYIKKNGTNETNTAVLNNLPYGLNIPVTAIRNVTVNAFKDNNDVTVLNSRNAQNFSPAGLNPWVSKTIGWSNLPYKNTEKHGTLDDNVVRSGFSIGSDAGSYRVPRVWLPGGVTIDVNALEATAGEHLKKRKMLVISTDAISRDWIDNGKKIGVSHSLLVFPKDAAGAVSHMMKVQGTNDGVRAVDVELFDHRGNLTTAGKSAGAISTTVRDYIEEQTGVIVSGNNYDYKGNLTPAKKKQLEHLINIYQDKGYNPTDKFTGVHGIVPIFSEEMGLNIGGQDDIVYKSTTQTSTTEARQGSSNFKQL